MPHVFIPTLYIDPASGSLFIQAVIAAIVVVPFVLRSQIRRAIARVRGIPDPGEAVGASDTPAPATGAGRTDDDAEPRT